MVAIAGCSSMNSPSSSLIDTVPVVKVGETDNVPKEHIVFIPANREFPIEVSVKGSVLNHDVLSKVMTSFKQDMYLYKYWASLDGKNWINSHKLINVEFSGGFGISGGKVEVKLNQEE
jgi:hypothetical protein